MRFSVVTISFNQARFLPECIDSILGQNYPDLEYIVVDPGSTDGSRDIIRSYGDQIIRCFEPDNGPADGLNKGFQLASGDIFCFVNSDDRLAPGALRSIGRCFATSDADIVHGHAYVIDEQGIEVRRVYSDRFDLKAAAYGSCVMIQPSCFFRSSAFKRSDGFNPANRSNWDGELFVDMALAGCKFYLVDELLSAYRVYGESITGSGKLSPLHDKHQRVIFEKIMGVPYYERNQILGAYLRYRRKMVNYRDTIERVRKGPVFMSGK